MLEMDASPPGNTVNLNTVFKSIKKDYPTFLAQETAEGSYFKYNIYYRSTAFNITVDQVEGATMLANLEHCVSTRITKIDNVETIVRTFFEDIRNAARFGSLLNPESLYFNYFCDVALNLKGPPRAKFLELLLAHHTLESIDEEIYKERAIFTKKKSGIVNNPMLVQLLGTYYVFEKAGAGPLCFSDQAEAFVAFRTLRKKQNGGLKLQELSLFVFGDEKETEDVLWEFKNKIDQLSNG